MHLEGRLYRFNGTTNEEDLQMLFYVLSQGFLYSGHIQSRNDYNIYIRTLELYFHSVKNVGIYGYNTQPTNLYLLLNDFPLGDSYDIKWVNSQGLSSALVINLCQSVLQSENKWNHIKTITIIGRKWSFINQEIV